MPGSRKLWICFLLLPPLLLSFTVHAQKPTALPYRIESLQSIPMITAIVWAPDGRMFFSEKNGTVQIISAEGVLQDKPVLKLDVRMENEDGVESVTLDPNFANNHYFYVFYTPVPEADGKKYDVITRYTEVNGAATNPVTLFHYENQSPLHQHNGGRLRFGPDGYLYFSLGDLSHWNARSQHLDTPEGKIHRVSIVDDQFQIPEGNPFPDSSIWAYGLRNVFSFVFDPLSGNLFATENGPDCDDALELVNPGDNFGWGLIPMSGDDKTYCSNPDRLKGAKPALISYTPTIAPAGITIYDGTAFPDWKGDLFFCAFKPSQLLRVSLNDKRDNLVGVPEPVPTGDTMGCGIEVAVGPDGYIYYSNTLGLYRIVPA